MRKDITNLIDDIKYTSDSLTDLDRLPVIQLNVILAKINLLTKKTTILLHYVEKQGEEQKKIRFSSEKESPVEDVTPIPEVEKDTPVEDNTAVPEVEMETVKSETNGENSNSGNVEDRLKQITIKDLTTAIGINEKYLFASELFEGKIESFTEAVMSLNAFESFDQAKNFMNNLANQYKWDPENESVISFTDLVARRFNQS